jgi:hypothetical protein
MRRTWHRENVYEICPIRREIYVLIHRANLQPTYLYKKDKKDVKEILIALRILNRLCLHSSSLPFSDRPKSDRDIANDWHLMVARLNISDTQDTPA